MGTLIKQNNRVVFMNRDEHEISPETKKKKKVS